jgi:hypothetical protein
MCALHEGVQLGLALMLIGLGADCGCGREKLCRELLRFGLIGHSMIRQDDQAKEEAGAHDPT